MLCALASSGTAVTAGAGAETGPAGAGAEIGAGSFTGAVAGVCSLGAVMDDIIVEIIDSSPP